MTRAADHPCPKCGFEMEWEECGNCDDYGFSGHECGEDSCCCANPENNVPCDICEGEGGWWFCLACHERSQM